MDAVRSARLKQVRLYVLLTSSLASMPLEDLAEIVLKEGAQALQLREKRMPDRRFLAMAKNIKNICRRHDALMIVNDRADIAVLAGADGLHLGQDDLPPNEARRVVGPEMIIGLSTHDQAQVAAASDSGADYIGIGPVFATATKGYDTGLGTDGLRKLASRSSLPTVAIGGIKAENVAEVMKSGASAVAVCSAIISEPDPARAARYFAATIRDATTR